MSWKQNKYGLCAEMILRET